MSKKKNNSTGGIIFSTDPNFRLPVHADPVQETLPSEKQKLKVRLDTKQRAGKAVTLVSGYAGKENDLQELGKTIKAFCGTGGSVKDGEIIIQGDQRDKVMQWLSKNGYGQAKKL